MKNIKNILMEEDIFPLGDFETQPVNLVLDGEPDSYPKVVCLQSVPTISQIQVEAEKALHFLEKKYVKERINYLTPLMTLEEIRNVLTDVGFTKEFYQSYSLRKLGTNLFEDFVESYTRDFFERLNCSYFRMQYAVAQPGWRTLFHIDHKNFHRHGFRAMVPLNSSVFISFLNENIEQVYELKAGSMYFVNIAQLHRAFNPYSEPRINLIFQMDSDHMILNGTTEQPISTQEAIQNFGSYLSPKIMEIWA